MPENLSWSEAAAIPVGGLTAFYFLREAGIRPGHKVLIYGASGSVGTYAVQLAAYFGAEVTGVCSTRNMELVRSLGADRVIDYTKEDFTRNGADYDIIFDAVGKAPFAPTVSKLKEKGVFLHAVATPGVSIRMQLAARVSGKRMIGGGPPNGPADLERLTELIKTGKVKPVIDRTYPLEEIVEAHSYVDTGRKVGNVTVTIG
jgi:NADPH:quinone reductase-like Zn-dependent oxidoreductase